MEEQLNLEQHSLIHLFSHQICTEGPSTVSIVLTDGGFEKAGMPPVLTQQLVHRGDKQYITNTPRNIITKQEVQ